MKFFMLAGGLGQRAEPLSKVKPKPIFPLNGTPLIERMIDQINGFDLAGGFINVHHLAEMIKEKIGHYSQIQILYEKHLSGSLILKKILPLLKDRLLLVNGDVYLEIPLPALENRLNQSNADGILLVKPEWRNDYPGLEIDGDRFCGLAKKPSTPAIFYTGVSILKKKVIEKIEYTNFFQSLAENSFDIRIMIHEGIWLDLGTPLSYFRANFAFKTHVGDDTSNAFSEDVTVSTDSTVRESVVWENTSLSAGCHISQSIITGNMHLKGVRCERKILCGNDVFPLF